MMMNYLLDVQKFQRTHLKQSFKTLFSFLTYSFSNHCLECAVNLPFTKLKMKRSFYTWLIVWFISIPYFNVLAPRQPFCNKVSSAILNTHVDRGFCPIAIRSQRSTQRSIYINYNPGILFFPSCEVRIFFTQQENDIEDTGLINNPVECVYINKQECFALLYWYWI